MIRVEKLGHSLSQQQQELFLCPSRGINEDYDRIYNQGEIELGWPEGVKKLYDDIARDNTVAIVGAALGDEGKGRIVDNKIEALLSIPGVQIVDVIRFQGGNNSGHTIEKDGIKLALHVVPAGVMYTQTIGIMDRGMIIHVEDLQTEVDYIETKVGDLRNKLFLSEEAILATDLERAQEVLNRIKSGHAKGGTGRGISPAYAHSLDRTGNKIYDLIDDNWRGALGQRYDELEKEFREYGEELAEINVPDFRTSQKVGKEVVRPVGSKSEFLDRLENARDWLLARELVTNTFFIHQKIFNNPNHGVLFEGAQALGLHPWLGRRPDVTSSDTSAYGIMSGTAYWRPQDIRQRIGVFKVPYSSSVGEVKMLTNIPFPKEEENTTQDQERALWISDFANERGTTTGRRRDITNLDLPLMVFNMRMSGAEMLAGTHVDCAREDQKIKVCTCYTDKNGKPMPYQPGIKYQQNIVPYYIELPCWDGELCTRAKTLKELPENALKFLAFVEARTGYPIIAVTTGPKRDNFIQFPGYHKF